MTAILANNATSRLASSLAIGATSLSVTAGEGSRFPSPSAGDWFPLTLVKATGSTEIVRCTARSGDVMTITRAQEGTAAQGFTAGDFVELRMTKAVVDEINTRIEQAEQTLADTIANLGLTGAVLPFPTATPPAGWLKCNGQAVSRAAYSTLFAVIGTTFGPGNGSTTFNVPDLRGEFVRGLDDSRGVDTGRALGSSQAAQMLSHNHTGTTSSDTHSHTFGATTSSAGGHTHTAPRAQNNDVGGGGPNFTTANGSNGTTAATNAAGEHTHTVSGGTSSDTHNHTFTTSTVGGAELRVRNVALLYCIKT